MSIGSLNLFPGGRRAAVSLTYDDGYVEHLDHAIPDLEEFNLRATFYLNTGPASPTVQTRAGEWRAAFERGHEIGNHTQFHPCSGKHEWVKPNFSLEAYTLDRMESELLAAERELRQMLGTQNRPHSYAYTCCEDFVGPQRTSYRPMVARLFPAARGGPARDLADPMNLDFSFVPAWMVGASTRIDQIQSFLDEALELGRWAVFIFHGIDGGHALNISRRTHIELCGHIASLRDELLCGTFVQVATAIREAAYRPWRSS